METWYVPGTKDNSDVHKNRKEEVHEQTIKWYSERPFAGAIYKSTDFGRSVRSFFRCGQPFIERTDQDGLSGWWYPANREST